MMGGTVGSWLLAVGCTGAVVWGINGIGLTGGFCGGI